MKLIRDYNGLLIRLTDERLAHIVTHPEMLGLEATIEGTLENPALVIQSLSDEAARLYYRLYSVTRIGDKVYMCGDESEAGRCLRADRISDRQTQAGNDFMERKHVKLWYDAEGDYLEVIFEDKEGYFRETASDQVMEKVDSQGNVIGFSVLKVSALKEHPLDVALGSD